MRRWIVAIALVGACDHGSSEGDAEGSSGASSGEASGGGDSSGTGGDESSGSGSGGTGDGFDCADVPVITYDTFGAGFLATYCNGCHGGQVVDRKGAPEAVVFDSREQVAPFAERILVRRDPPEGVTPMPPAGGVTEDDAVRLEIWLRCYP